MYDWFSYGSGTGYRGWLCSLASPQDYAGGILSLFEPQTGLSYWNGAGYIYYDRPCGEDERYGSSQTNVGMGVWTAASLGPGFSYEYKQSSNYGSRTEKYGWFEKRVASGVRVSSLAKVEAEASFVVEGTADTSLAPLVLGGAYQPGDGTNPAVDGDSPFNPSPGNSDDGNAPSLPVAGAAVAFAAIGGAAYVMRGSLAAFISRYYSGIAARPGEIAAQEAKNAKEREDYDRLMEEMKAASIAEGNRWAVQWNQDISRIRLAEAQAAATREAALMLAGQNSAPNSASVQPKTKSQMSSEAYKAGLALTSGQKSSTTIGGTVFDISKDAKGNVSVTPHWTTAPATLTPVQQQMADDAKARADKTAAMYKNTATIAKQDQTNVELLIAKYGIVGTLENIEDGKMSIPDRQVALLKDRLYAIKGSDLEGEAFWQAELLMHRAASGDAEAKAKVTALSMVTSQDFLGLNSGYARLTGNEQGAYEIKRDAITAYFRERLVNENPTLGYITGAPVVQLAAAAGLGFGANAAITVGMKVAPVTTSLTASTLTAAYTYNVGATAVEYIQEGDYAGLGAFITIQGLEFGAFGYGANMGAKTVVEKTGVTNNFIIKTGSAELRLSPHAIKRMNQRAILIKDVEKVAGNAEPFPYYHDGIWKNGYYDSQSKIFFGEFNGEIKTVINDVTPQYIKNLQKSKPISKGFNEG
jgi:hypothetical protein